MGHTTEFKGSFKFDKPLSNKIRKFLKKLNETRRVKRNVDLAYGVDGEFFVFDKGFVGQDNVVNHNEPPSTQPSLWCRWKPNKEGTKLKWDGVEKFYDYTEWLVYIIDKILTPNGYTLNGKVKYWGELIAEKDSGEIRVVNNVVYLDGKVMTIHSATKIVHKNYISSEVENFMRPDVVVILNEDDNQDFLLEN